MLLTVFLKKLADGHLKKTQKFQSNVNLSLFLRMVGFYLIIFIALPDRGLEGLDGVFGRVEDARCYHNIGLLSGVYENAIVLPDPIK